jgi:hypothetical protein
MKKKLLALAIVLALVAALVVPMAVSAAVPLTASENVTVFGATVAPTIGLSSLADFAFSTFQVGDNYTHSGELDVTFAPGSDQYATWTLSAFSQNDGSGADYSSGLMYCQALANQLGSQMQVSLNGISYANLPGGVTTSASTATSAAFYVYAYQNVTKADVLAGSGTYTMIVNLMATVTP